MTTISATTILRSRNASRPEKVLSTLLLRYPRFIHAEFLTHRMISRNAASSRAIPVGKLIRDVIENPAVPIFWGKNQKGMQAGEELTGVDLEYAKNEWDLARQEAIYRAQRLAEIGAHKQIVNRILEPFSHITVLASATEWANFLALRDHPAAEPHIQMLAREVRKCLEDESTIQTLQPGEWHLPFVGAPSPENVEKALGLDPDAHWNGPETLESAKILSGARCASTSYKTVDGFDMDLERARAIYDNLVRSDVLHASPFEHVAQADEWGLHGEVTWHDGYQPCNSWKWGHQHGNFVGFRQLRKQMPGEWVPG